MNTAQPRIVERPDRHFFSPPRSIEWDLLYGESREVVARIDRQGDDLAISPWVSAGDEGAIEELLANVVDAEGNPLPAATDISMFRLRAEAKFYDAPANIAPVPWLATRKDTDFPVVVATVNARAGLIRMELPADMPPANPAFGAETVPVAEVHLEVSDSRNPNTWIRRFLARYGHGPDVTAHPEGMHQRIVGWSAGPTPTQDELDAALQTTDNDLSIPERTTPGYLFFGVTSDPGLPRDAYYDGSMFDILASGYQARGTHERGGLEYSVMSTRVLQNHKVLGTGDRILTLRYTR